MMHLKHLGIFVDTAYQFIVNDFKHPTIQKMVKQEMNRWLSLSEKLIGYYKKELKEDEKVEEFEDKVACLYEVSKVVFSLPKEELEKVTDIFKKINYAISQTEEGE